jgi:uncharacterized protein (TIGR02453 family)
MWPPEALQFFHELENNNNREWFKANRSRYDNDLLAPTRALAERLSGLGEPHYFRPYRDTRFRPGPPISEHIALGIGEGAVAGYYVALSLDGLVVGAGLHHPTTDQLERFRAAIAQDRPAAAFERTVLEAEARGLQLAEPALKRAPRGYPADHPRLDLLRLKDLTVHRQHPLEPWLHQPGCDERIEAELESTRPFVDWITKTIGPPLAPAARASRG